MRRDSRSDGGRGSVRRPYLALAVAGALGLAGVGSNASAQPVRVRPEPDVVHDGHLHHGQFRPFQRAYAHRSASGASSGKVSVTADKQILVELAPRETTASNLFDLNGRTLVFTPDGRGGYSRSVGPVAWENDIGPAVADGAEVSFEDFEFEFGGREWTSFYVSSRGVITFGERLKYSHEGANRGDTMRQIRSKLVTSPTISVLHKPLLGGFYGGHALRQHVAKSPDQVVITWITYEPDYYVHGAPPERPIRLQAVLAADGSVRLSYRDVSFGDGIVGLFADGNVEKGALIGRVVDGVDSDLPGHLDLLEAGIYETNRDMAIIEFTTRGRIPTPPAGSTFGYTLHIDVDRPWWTRLDFSERDLFFGVALWDGDPSVWGPGASVLPRSDGGNVISMLVDLGDLEGASLAVIASADEWDSVSWVNGEVSPPAVIRVPVIGWTDLSRSDTRSTSRQNEMFHYQGKPDLESVTCRVVETLGDQFDVLLFHSEFRLDHQEAATPFSPYYANSAEGLGISLQGRPPCGARLKGGFAQPVWMWSSLVFDSRRTEGRRFDPGLVLFAHEFIHTWTAKMSYLRDGRRNPLFGDYCQCHWLEELHVPAVFPWHADHRGPKSTMGGSYWRENANGTFTPHHGYYEGGPSWLDLYAMGLGRRE